MKTIDINDIHLQPLKIPTGWNVEWNNFFDIEATWDTKVINSQGIDIYPSFFTEDLLQISHKVFGYLLDLGWYPDCDETGLFRLLLLDQESDSDWETPLFKFESRNKAEVASKIEYLLDQYSRGSNISTS